jgi:hypothetical protein
MKTLWSLLRCLFGHHVWRTIAVDVCKSRNLGHLHPRAGMLCICRICAEVWDDLPWPTDPWARMTHGPTPHVPMTLEQALEHTRERAVGNSPCAVEHRQLAAWLEELQRRRMEAR